MALVMWFCAYSSAMVLLEQYGQQWCHTWHYILYLSTLLHQWPHKLLMLKRSLCKYTVCLQFGASLSPKPHNHLCQSLYMGLNEVNQRILDNLQFVVLRQRSDVIQSTTYEHGYRVGFKEIFAGSKE